MAMNKAEKAALEAAQREARLRELIVLKPPILPDIPAPVSGGKAIRGYAFNVYSSHLNVGYYESTITGHYSLNEAGKRIGSGSQQVIALYSTRELAYEAAKIAAVWVAAQALLTKVEQYERNN
jgi:hypothetical protein